MSHHINFDIPDFENKASSPKPHKAKEENSARKRETKKLEIDNKQMEWRLSQLKMAMEKQKEERGKQGFIWKSGKNGALDSHARNVLGRSVTTTSKSSKKGEGKKPKVSILKDEPLDIPKRNPHSKELINKLLKPTPPKSPLKAAQPSENENRETWISVAVDRTSDEVMELQSDQSGNLPLSSLHGINPDAIGLYFVRYGRKRLLLAIDNKVIKPKSGWGSEVYFPYVANISPQKIKMTPTPPPSSRVNKGKKRSEVKEPQVGGKLLMGTFDEEENARSFQDALTEWRKGGSEKPSHRPVVVEMVAHDVQSDPVSVNIEFSETSTLSYMERLLVKKHRESEVPPLPNGTLNGGKENMADESYGLTAEEIDDRERIRQLFTPQPSVYSGGDSVSTIEARSSVCFIAEVDDADVVVQNDNWTGVGQSESRCYVEEVSDDDEHMDDVTQQDSVRIEDFLSSHLDSVNLGDKTNGNVTTSAENQQLHLSRESHSLKHPTHNANNTKKSIPGAVKHNSTTKKELSALVSAVGDIPLNPDAFYENNLSEFQSDMNSKWNELNSNLDQHPSSIMLCNRGDVHWSAEASVAQNRPATAGREIPTSYTKIDEVIEREMDDARTLNQLEWELASQNGNITNDGRISRLIDNWSSDDELGIVNDPGLGSGLSTPEVDGSSLVGTSLSHRHESQFQEDFQRMETFMLGDIESDEEEINSL